MSTRDQEKPAYPRAPSQDAWDSMTPTQRACVVDSLPPFMTEEECSPSPGDPHSDARFTARESLREHFSLLRRRAYVGSDIVVYYPDTSRFAPDLFVVLDAEPGDRDSWIVSAEATPRDEARAPIAGGLDFVLGVVYRQDRQKYLVENVSRYEKLGIPEYFVYDRERQYLRGFRLRGGRYSPIQARHGFLESEVLGMRLVIEDDRLRFYVGAARVLEPKEYFRTFQKIAEQGLARLEAAQRADAEEEQSRARTDDARQAAAARAEQVQAELAALRAELEALKRGT